MTTDAIDCATLWWGFSVADHSLCFLINEIFIYGKKKYNQMTNIDNQTQQYFCIVWEFNLKVSD